MSDTYGGRRLSVAAWMLANVLAFATAAEAQTGLSGTGASTQPAGEESAGVWPPGAMMDAMGGAKTPMEDWGFRIYGFAQSGFTGRLTGGQDPLPFRAFDARRPNNLRINQLSLAIERVYDTKKDLDVGGKVQGLFGGDAMLTHSAGLFDKAGEGKGDAWADLFQAYVTAWIKTGDDSGLEALVGKFVTPCGFEAVEGALAPMYSHSLLFAALPFTHTGAKLTYTFDPQWSAYFAVVEGWDVFNDNNNACTYMTGGSWRSQEKNGDNPVHQVFVNLMTGPEQNDNVRNYRTVADVSYTRWWTDKLSQTLNADFGNEADAGLSGGDADWYGLAHYLSYVFSDKLTGIWRAEWFRDQDGRWTGAAGNLCEMTFGAAVTPWPADKALKNLVFRPEFRWDFSCDNGAFGGGRNNQLTLAMDVVFKF